jgi:hypothetical protein
MCSPSGGGIKAVDIPKNQHSVLQFSLKSSDFAPSENAFKSSLVTFYDCEDGQVASLQLSTLRDQFAQVVLQLHRKEQELNSNWEAIEPAALIKLALDSQNGNVYLNGKKLIFQISVSKSSAELPSNEPLQWTSALIAEKPAEWKEIEEFLTFELQESIQLTWQTPLQVVSEAPKAQVFANQAATFSLTSVTHVAFDEQVVLAVALEPSHQSLARYFAFLKAGLPRFKAGKETWLMVALISGFVGYLGILTLLSRMTVKTKLPKHQQQQQQQQTLDQNSKQSIIMHTSQTKSTDILRPVKLLLQFPFLFMFCF